MSQRSRLRQRGLSLVELMVGITVGLIVAAAASMVMVNQIRGHRQQAIETQLQQDLRAAVDLIQNDIRRAGFWAAPEQAVWAAGQPAARNPYQAATGCSAKSAEKQYVYVYSKADYGLKTSNDSSQGPQAEADEYFGLRLRDRQLYFMFGCTNGPNWQPLTDTATLIVEDISIVAVPVEVSLSDYCAKPCSGNACPRLQRHRLDITVWAHSAIDKRVKRRLEISSQPRNDGVTGACPA